MSREISPLESAVITVGSIHGGSKHNIIGDSVKLQLTVRSYSDETRDYLLRRIREISLGLVLTAGMPQELLPEVSIKDEYTPSVYNDPTLTDQAVAVLKSQLGEQNVRPACAPSPHWRAACLRQPHPDSLFLFN